MSGQNSTSAGLLRWRLGVLGLLLGALVGGPLLWQAVSEAGAPPLEPQVLAFFKDRQLQVAVGLTTPNEPTWSGPLSVELLGAGGKSLGRVQHDLKNADALTRVRFDFDASKDDASRLNLRIAFRARQTEIPLGKVLLGKAHETTLSAGTDLYPGSQAALICTVQGVRSIAETIPHAGSDVKIRLRDAQGKTQDLYQGKTGKDGRASAAFEVPSVEPGAYTMEIVTRSIFGEEKLERQVHIKADGKILLVTDKPLYQPGQVMHLRALALRSFDMKPLDNRDLLFEVEDSRGNKVFKRSFKTSDFGIASVDFQLADEVNMGDYHLRAMIGDLRAEKTVQVKRYVLPRFKIDLKADKTFYLPKEKLAADLQCDYFFGKPVANSKIEVTASTFDVAFKEFQRWKGMTDAQGHARFDIVLPDYFVGQPLQNGNAIVKLEVKVLDNADHTETVTRSYPVSEQPIRVSVIAEGGKLVPEMDNRLFLAALYADGSPAPNTEIKLWHHKLPDAQQNMGGRFQRGGRPMLLPPQAQAPQALPAPEKEAKLGEPLAVVKTNAAGLAEVTIKPIPEQFRSAGWGMQDVELIGGNQQRWGAQMVYDLRLDARDARGNLARSAAALSSQPLGENVLLRLDRAIYQTGDRMNLDVRTSAGLPTVYVDIVRGGQIMLSKWLDVKDGRAEHALDLPPHVFGSLEIHAYQMLGHGEIIRASRVVYVQPRNDLKIKIEPGKAEHEPGADGRIRFSVTDQAGKPVAAALGIIIVDEAVYALQDLQPGLEKVYFTLQEELLKPQTQIKLSPGDTLENLVRQPVIPAPRQQIAEVLLTSVKLPPPQRWEVQPALERKREIEQRITQLSQSMYQYAWSQEPEIVVFDRDQNRWAFRKDLLETMVKKNAVHPTLLDNGFGGKLTLAELARIEKAFLPENLARAITVQRLQQWHWQLQNYASQNPKFLKNGRWTLPDRALEEAAKIGGIDKRWLLDGFGQPLRLVQRERKDVKKPNPNIFEDYDIVSVGPAGKLGDKGNLNIAEAVQLGQVFGGMQAFWWAEDRKGSVARRFEEGLGLDRDRILMRADGHFAPANKRAGVPMPMQANGRGMPEAAGIGGLGLGGAGNAGAGGGAPAPVTRIREYFPETMLWQPALITDDRGHAELALQFADSITTWRLSASANSRGGAIGGADVPLKVFQDFFVDIDLPVHLTQTDEVAFPVAVFNYLKTPQTVTIELQKESWFELLESPLPSTARPGVKGSGFVRTLALQPNEVTSVSYRIRAGKIGFQPLTVKALGSKKSDAVKRLVEVVPNGQKFEKVVSDRLSGNIRQSIALPANALPDASRLLVKMVPGAMAQVVDGLDGMLRMPCGCFEQTSSSAYPNIMIVDYIKKNRIASPEMLMKAEQYLNVGYQRLLTFERPGGGFDWWGREEPLIWTSAYGLQEFADMARVYPIDRGIIDRTQAFLMKKREADGTWSNIGATHGETIASMGNPKLLLTSYVTWSLLESGYDRKQLQVSIDYIRANLAAAGENTYILALAANALAAFDAKDDSTLQALQRLDKLRKEAPDLKVQYFPSPGTSLTYGRGDSVAVETTALAVLAMIKTGQFNTSVNQALAFLVKSKQAGGTWGTTQATILALKALLGGMGASTLKDDVHFTIKLNGKEAVRGKIGKADADVLQAFDLKGFTPTGPNDVQIEVDGETNLMYQIIARHYEPWQKETAPKKPAIDVSVEYDRTKLSTKDLLKVRATLKYQGELPTYMVMLDLGIAPGFTVDPGDFAEMVGKNKIKKFEITPRQVILYLGDVRPGDELTFDYVLRPRFPLRAQTPSTVAYEYNTPGNRAVARPVELTVEDRK